MASLTSDQIIRQAYVRIAAWQGDPTAINAQYNADVDFEQVVTESFPPQAMWDSLTGVEGEMALAVANNQDSVYRKVLHDTVAVTSGGLIPSAGDSSANAKIIGVWGQVRDTDTGIELTPALHEDEVRAVVNGPSGLFKSTLNSYALRPPRIYATVSSLTIDVCTFDSRTRLTTLSAGGIMLFQQFFNGYVAGLMSNLKNQDPLYNELSNQYAPMYAQFLTALNPPRPIVAEAAA